MRPRFEPVVVMLSLAFAVMWKPLPLVDVTAGLRRDVEAVAASRRHRWPSP
jgi:hypothetical protein